MPGGGIIDSFVQGALDGLMREIWTGTLALLRAVLGLVGELGSIDITPGGGAISNELWTTMLQLAGVIAMILFFAQLAATALNPRRNLFQATTGPLQYGVALALSIALVAALLGASDGLSSIILTQGANVTDTAAAMDQLGLVDDNNAVKAVVLGFLGIIGVLPLAIGYGITLLFRSASILVLVATLPITAAGLTNLATKHWFWRVSRWLLALIFLKPAFALCFALGSGIVAAAGRTEGPAPAAPGAEAVAPADGSGIVTLLLGLGIMFVALFAPYALFRLFAFIEPGTQPHQAMMSAFSSAMAGARSSASGIATADIGSVFSGATGGRFAGGGGGAGGALAGLGGGGSGPDGSGGAGGNTKQQAAMAGLAMATGGASAAAGAAGAGAGGATASGATASGAGASSSGAVGGATRALAGVGGGARDGGARDGGTGQEQAGDRDAEQDALAGAGAAAHDTGGPQVGESSDSVAAPAYSGAGAGAGGARSGGGSVGVSAGSASAGSASAGSASAGGAAGGASGGGSGAGSGGSWSIAGAASAAAVQARGYAGGRAGHAFDAGRGVASGFAGAAGAIGGSAPMRAAPMGGAVGSIGGGPNNTPDYGGGYFHRSRPSSYPSRRDEHPDDGYSGSYYPPLQADDDARGQVGGGYRDESFDDDRGDQDDGRHDGGDEDQGMSGVIR